MKKQTSWHAVARWYAEYVADPESYHAQVVLPNLMRLIEPKPGEKILDLACGTGFFSKAFAEEGARVTGVDIGPALIEEAKKHVPRGTFFVAPAHKLDMISAGSMGKISLVLAIQNIGETKEVFAECARILAPGGKLWIVMNHPNFRIPKGSSWEWDDKHSRQYRRIDYYMSEKTVDIDMNPGISSERKKKTVSFHRPLQYYFKLLGNAGFAITRLEEWTSHKHSEKGPRQKEEDRMRKEIPLFMLIEAEKRHA